MGTAKSSLYFYYRNKEEMLSVLLQNHIRRIESLTGRIVPSGRDLAEQLYISVALQTNYLILQPNSIPVFNWIHYEMTTDGDRESVASADLAEFLSHYRVDELGPDKERFIYVLKWAMVLASATVSQGMRFIDDPKKLRLAVRDMFKRILRGEKEIS
jgi:AcrR family transcriptional regulator